MAQSPTISAAVVGGEKVKLQCKACKAFVANATNSWVKVTKTYFLLSDVFEGFKNLLTVKGPTIIASSNQQALKDCFLQPLKCSCGDGLAFICREAPDHQSHLQGRNFFKLSRLELVNANGEIVEKFVSSSIEQGDARVVPDTALPPHLAPGQPGDSNSLSPMDTPDREAVEATSNGSVNWQQAHENWCRKTRREVSPAAFASRIQHLGGGSLVEELQRTHIGHSSEQLASRGIAITNPVPNSIVPPIHGNQPQPIAASIIPANATPVLVSYEGNMSSRPGGPQRQNPTWNIPALQALTQPPTQSMIMTSGTALSARVGLPAMPTSTGGPMRQVFTTFEANQNGRPGASAVQTSTHALPAWAPQQDSSYWLSVRLETQAREIEALKVSHKDMSNATKEIDALKATIQEMNMAHARDVQALQTSIQELIMKQSLDVQSLRVSTAALTDSTADMKSMISELKLSVDAERTRSPNKIIREQNADGSFATIRVGDSIVQPAAIENNEGTSLTPARLRDLAPRPGTSNIAHVEGANRRSMSTASSHPANPLKRAEAELLPLATKSTGTDSESDPLRVYGRHNTATNWGWHDMSATTNGEHTSPRRGRGRPPKVQRLNDTDFERGRIIRRGSGFESPTHARPRRKPTRDEHGNLLRADGSLDRRSITSAQNLKKMAAAKSLAHERTLPQVRDLDPSPLVINTDLSVLNPATVDARNGKAGSGRGAPQEMAAPPHEREAQSIREPEKDDDRHAAVMKQMFPHGVADDTMRMNHAARLFAPDSPERARMMQRDTLVEEV